MTPKQQLHDLREMLKDWYMAVEIQRDTGNASIRNGVERRMHKLAESIFHGSDTASGEQK